MPVTLQVTPSWLVAAVCAVIIVISLLAQRFLHYLGKVLKRKHHHALYEALQNLEEELMLLGFISLLLTVFQRTIQHICVPRSFLQHMLPCNRKDVSPNQKVDHPKGSSHQFSKKKKKKKKSHQFSFNNRKLLSESDEDDVCITQGKVPLLSLEALHLVHNFIFVLAVVHVVFCVTTMALGGAKIRKWKRWENAIRKGNRHSRKEKDENSAHAQPHQDYVMERTMGPWQRSVVLCLIMSFFRQFYASVTKSDYTALRSGFIISHCSSNPHFDFNKYMLRTLSDDFKIIVSIRWYLWLFLVIFILVNVNGWHAIFWLSFLPLILLLAVGTKLEYIITCLAQEAAKKPADGQEAPLMKPSDRFFWLNRPGILLYLIHFILFQNAFEMAFFFAILTAYGFGSCMMGKIGFVIPRLVIGVIIQVLCSYSTLPLYTIVTQMGDMFKQAIFDEQLRSTLHGWAKSVRRKKRKSISISSFMKGFNSRSKKDESCSVQMQQVALEADGAAESLSL